MSRKVTLSPKELMASVNGGSAGSSLAFKSVEEAAAAEKFEDDESDDDEEGSEECGGGSDDSGDSPQKPRTGAGMGKGRGRGASSDSESESDSPEPTNKVVGKEGWIYRENDAQLKLQEPFTKIWISIFDNRLLFSRDAGSNGAFSLFEATQKVQSVCFGYLNLGPGTEVKRQLLNNKGTKGKGVQDKSKKFQFSVKDGDSVIMFGTDTDEERDSWVEVIKAAIKGVSHFLPLSHLELPPGAVGIEDDKSISASITEISSKQGGGSRMDARKSVVFSAVDFPNKAGFLKKSSQGKSAFGISVVKKRWFRLAAGELRYYEDEDESATKLKECIHLEGAEVLPLVGCVVHVQFTGGRAMKLEAPTPKIAVEWKDAFSETIELLKVLPSSSKEIATLKPVRRLNVHDSDADRVGAVPKVSPAMGSATSSPGVASPASAGSASRRGRSATTMSISPSPAALASAKAGDSDDSDDDTPVPTGSFWGRLTVSSKSPQVSSLSRKQRSMSTTGSVPVSNAGVSSDYRPKFMTPKSGGSTTKCIETIEMLQECLQQNFLLKRLPDLQPLIDVMEEHVAVPGEVIIWQGSSGDAFYALESGQCEVIKDGRCVSRIPAGKSFGELALVNNATRQATIRASQVCTLWTFTRKQYRDVAMKQEAQLMEERILFLEQITLFSKLLRSSLEKIADVMVLKSYNTGERIIKQGDSGDAFYMIQQGRVVVTQTSTFSTSAGTELARLGPGKHFGELALIEDAPRKATVTATSACKCWTLDRQNFKSLFGSMDEAVNESVGIKMLQKVKILEALTEMQLQTVARCLVSQQFVEGEVIIKQGDVGDCFYLISEGEVSVQVNHIQVATLEGGSFFGEMSLLSNERRSATVSAIQPTTCLVLSRADFDELLGPLEEVIEEARRRKEAALRPRGGDGGGSRFLSSLRRVSDSIFSTSTSPGSSPTPTLTRAKSMNSPKAQNSLFSSTSAMFELSSLERVKKLGTGTFGTVFLVQHIMTNKYYALKVLHKQHLKEKCQEETVFGERDIMLALADSLYVAELYATLQDSKSLYLVQKYIPGGDLWDLLHKSSKLKKTKEGGFSLNKSLFYFSNVLGAIGHMHSQEIVYRNIKPENFVVDSAGYLRVVDFGSAKRLPIGRKTNTLCGAAEYIAPEMVLSKGYNKAIDFWAMGVLLFELLTCSTPFAHPNLSMVYQNIMDSEGVVKLIFSGGQGLSASSSSSSAVAAGASSAGIDAQAKDVISNLLLFNPNMRLGMRHDGVKDIWSHPCLKEFSLEKLESRSLKAPFMPTSDESELAVVSDEDVMDVLEDEDDIPIYRGNFDYSDF